MSSARIAAILLSAASAVAMLYVGLYQVRLVKKLICPLFGGCEAVADAPFARPFGVPDGFIALGLYGVILGLLLWPIRPAWLTWTILALAVRGCPPGLAHRACRQVGRSGRSGWRSPHVPS